MTTTAVNRPMLTAKAAAKITREFDVKREMQDDGSVKLQIHWTCPKSKYDGTELFIRQDEEGQLLAQGKVEQDGKVSTKFTTVLNMDKVQELEILTPEDTQLVILDIESENLQVNTVLGNGSDLTYDSKPNQNEDIYGSQTTDLKVMIAEGNTDENKIFLGGVDKAEIVSANPNSQDANNVWLDVYHTKTLNVDTQGLKTTIGTYVVQEMNVNQENPDSSLSVFGRYGADANVQTNSKEAEMGFWDVTSIRAKGGSEEVKGSYRLSVDSTHRHRTKTLDLNFYGNKDLEIELDSGRTNPSITTNVSGKNEVKVQSIGECEINHLGGTRAKFTD